jgi:hypothetical protein
MGKIKTAILFSILSLGLMVGKADAAVSFNDLDRNDNGSISRSEWRWTTLSFRTKDANHDGVVSRDEYYRRVYSNRTQRQYNTYNDDYVANSYPVTYPNTAYNPGYVYNTPYNYNPGVVYNPGAVYNPGYGYNPYNSGLGGISPLGALGGLAGLGGYGNPGYVSKGAAQTGAALNLVGSLLSTVMAFR